MCNIVSNSCELSTLLVYRGSASLCITDNMLWSSHSSMVNFLVGLTMAFFGQITCTVLPLINPEPGIDQKLSDY